VIDLTFVIRFQCIYIYIYIYIGATEQFLCTVFIITSVGGKAVPVI
jgi:hypothetical protein